MIKKTTDCYLNSIYWYKQVIYIFLKSISTLILHINNHRPIASPLPHSKKEQKKEKKHSTEQ